jgi:hypothetical protein
MPQAQLFEVDGLNPPRRISKLSLRYRRSIAAVKKDNMPPRVARLPSGRATVNQNHPAATAAAAAARVVAAGIINGVKISAPTSRDRDSPSRAAKMLANEKMSEICHHNPRTAVAVEAPDDAQAMAARTAVAVEAPDDAQATAGVTVDFTAVAATGVTVLDAVVPAEIPLVAALPPLWNAWWCGACTALHFVGDGGELRGPCLMCQVRNPIRNHVMLGPDEREELRRTPGLSYQTLSSGIAYSPPLSFSCLTRCQS